MIDAQLNENTNTLRLQQLATSCPLEGESVPLPPTEATLCGTPFVLREGRLCRELSHSLWIPF